MQWTIFFFFVNETRWRAKSLIAPPSLSLPLSLSLSLSVSLTHTLSICLEMKSAPAARRVQSNLGVCALWRRKFMLSRKANRWGTPGRTVCLARGRGGVLWLTGRRDGGGEQRKCEENKDILQKLDTLCLRASFSESKCGLPACQCLRLPPAVGRTDSLTSRRPNATSRLASSRGL